MAWTREIWRQSVARLLFEFGSIPFQKALWTGQLRGFSSHFDESICRFDDYGIPEFLGEFVAQKFLTDNESNELKNIATYLDKFCANRSEEQLSHEIIWNEQGWENFEAQCARLLKKSFWNDLDFEKSEYREWKTNYYR